MVSSLWQKKTYLLDTPIVVAHRIYEYDIKKANINVLLAMGLIEKEYYDKLYKMKRMDRQVEIGYLLKFTKGLSDQLSDGIKSYRCKFFEANNLEDGNILSIKNDAIFVIDKKCSHTTFDNIEFVLKNEYSLFMRLSRNIEIYFQSSIINNSVQLDIKGISDEKVDLHFNYMANIIADVLYYIEIGDINSGLTYISNIYNQYIDKQLDPGYYRNFNSSSDYTIIANGAKYSLQECVSKDTFDALDISCNLSILRELYGYLTQIYFSRR